MKNVKRLINQQKKIIDEWVNSKHDHYCISFKGDTEIFSKNLAKFKNLKFDHNDNLDTYLNNGLNEIHTGIGFAYSSAEIRRIPVIRCFNDSGYLVFTLSQDRLLITALGETQYAADEILARINAYYQKHFNNSCFAVEITQKDCQELQERIEYIEKYYIGELGAWTQDFIDNLGDEISKISFREFLKQRVQAHILWNCDQMYPIIPPPATAAWRKEREDNTPQKPILDHYSSPINGDFFFLHTFVYEQYAIEGVVEAEKGDTVIDAGAYIGDTALYFAQKVGERGKVYAFEAIPQLAEYARDNIQKNKVNNIEMVTNALTDTCKELLFAVYDEVPSNSTTENLAGYENNVKVQGIPLDDFTAKHNIKVDFIKLDVEGGELDLLHGAKETIRRDKPKCGIALYHKKEDYYVLPKLLKELCPDYVFYFRCEAEPVLLAKVK